MADRKFQMHDGQKGSALAVRVTPRASRNEIVEILVGEHHAVLDPVLDHRLAVTRRLEADRGLDAGRRLRRVRDVRSATVETEVKARGCFGQGLLAC